MAKPLLSDDVDAAGEQPRSSGGTQVVERHLLLELRRLNRR
jgi:hypothetical protein